MRRAKLDKFARELLAEWRRLELPSGESRVVLAVSGGADSTALTLACEELRRAGLLRVEMLVAHLNHGLRGRAGADDARWVAELGAGLGFDVSVGRSEVAGRARETGDNLEQAARHARYEFLAETARGWNACAVLAAHTLDDQAETVLLRLLRGSGAEGLGGMRAVRRLGADDATPVLLLVRPLVRWARRAETESYCLRRGVAARTDEMNADERFARVRVRRQLLPLVETFNPRAVEALARTAELLREDASTLEALAAKLLTEASGETSEGRKGERENEGDERDEKGDESKETESKETERKQTAKNETGDGLKGVPPLRVGVLARAPQALRRRALRRWIGAGRGDLRRVEMVHVASVERLLEGARGGRVAELPGGCSVERRRGWLVFRGAGRGGS